MINSRKDKQITAYGSLIFSATIGVVLGLTAKLVDVPEITSVLPIFDDLFGRFSIWIFVATMLSVSSNTPIRASVKIFAFFASMLMTYYAYTICILGFFPRTQIYLWSLISLISPICAAAIWHSKEKGYIGNVFAALPVTAIGTEWYVTGRENILLLVIYLCMIICLLLYVPKNRKRYLPIILIALAMTLPLIKTGSMEFIYGALLNI